MYGIWRQRLAHCYIGERLEVHDVVRQKMTHFAMAGDISVFCFQFPSMCERIKLQMFDWYVAGVGFICFLMVITYFINFSSYTLKIHSQTKDEFIYA